MIDKLDEESTVNVLARAQMVSDYDLARIVVEEIEKDKRDIMVQMEGPNGSVAFQFYLRGPLLKDFKKTLESRAAFIRSELRQFAEQEELNSN